ncbi:MAG: hypothetical protein ACLFUJ_12265 [Phycisphaerae bacterium]
MTSRNDSNRKMTRRAWLARAGRMGIGAGLAAIAATALGRRGREGTTDQGCDPATCDGCGIEKTCNLPAAETYRKTRSL